MGYSPHLNSRGYLRISHLESRSEGTITCYLNLYCILVLYLNYSFVFMCIFTAFLFAPFQELLGNHNDWCRTAFEKEAKS